MALHAASRFEAETVVTLRVMTQSGRLEIKFANTQDTEHIVSLPLPAAMELATFISDIAEFLSRLDKGADAA
jgi:hypothetical protein